MIFTLRTEMYMTPVKHANTKFHSYVPYELLPCYFSPGSVGGGPSYELLHTTHAFAAGPRCTASTDLLTYLQGTDSVRRERTRPKRALHVQSHKQILLALRPFIIPLSTFASDHASWGDSQGTLPTRTTALTHDLRAQARCMEAEAEAYPETEAETERPCRMLGKREREGGQGGFLSGLSVGGWGL